jgi:hypothetical protein
MDVSVFCGCRPFSLPVCVCAFWWRLRISAGIKSLFFFFFVYTNPIAIGASLFRALFSRTNRRLVLVALPVTKGRHPPICLGVENGAVWATLAAGLCSRRPNEGEMFLETKKEAPTPFFLPA